MRRSFNLGLLPGGRSQPRVFIDLPATYDWPVNIDSY